MIRPLFSATLTAAAFILLASSAQAATIAHSVTDNGDGSTTYSRTTTGDTTIVTPVGSDDMYVTSTDPVYPMSSTTTTTTYVNGAPTTTTWTREANHPLDEYDAYYVNNAPAKTYAVGVDENGNTTQRYENMTVDNYNN